MLNKEFTVAALVELISILLSFLYVVAPSIVTVVVVVVVVTQPNMTPS